MLMRVDESIGMTEFYKTIEPLTMELITVFEHVYAEVLRKMDEAEEKGWTSEKLIEEIGVLLS